MRSIPNYIPGGDVHLEVTSWLGPQLLATLPVVDDSWSVEDEADVDVPGLLEFDVPDTPAMRAASDPRHPLAKMGQRFRTRLYAGGVWITLGWFRSKGSAGAGEHRSVRGVGLLEELRRAQFTYPTPTGGTRYQALNVAVGNLLPVYVRAENGLVFPHTWERDRLAGFWELMNSWPARPWVDDSGALVVDDPWTTTIPVVTLGEPGPEQSTGVPRIKLTSVGEPDAANEDPHNGYVVESQPEGGAAPLVGAWTVPTGPMAWGGTYGQNPGFFSSPLLPPDGAVLEGVARTMTQREMRIASTVQFEAPLDPRLQVGDRCWIRSSSAGVDTTGRVTMVKHTSTRTSGKVAIGG